MYLNRKVLWTLCLLLILAWPAAARAEGRCLRIPSIEVDGSAKLTLPPDQAELRLGVVTRDLKAAVAARQNAAVMQKLVAALKAKLGPKDRLQTVRYEVAPVQKWDAATKSYRMEGYRCTNTVKVLLRDVKRTGDILDLARQAGANQVNGPYWSLADASAVRRKVQVMALKNALAQAKALAKAAGVKLGPPLKIDATQGGEPVMFRSRVMMKAAPRNAATPVEPGRVSVSAQVRCVFALQSKP